MKDLKTASLVPKADGFSNTIARRTRRVYDRLAPVYPISTFLFHSAAHGRALAVSGITDGMRVLEVATGSGEMFLRLVRANRSGETFGSDLSPNMAAHTHRRVRREFPRASAFCQAVDARYIPFRDESFDAVVCCYLLELLCADDILRALGEFHRVLRRRGRLTLVCVGQNTDLFSRVYGVLGRIAPAFWGRQVDGRLTSLIRASRFRIVSDEQVRQVFYPSRVLVAGK